MALENGGHTSSDRNESEHRQQKRQTDDDQTSRRQSDESDSPRTTNQGQRSPINVGRRNFANQEPDVPLREARETANSQEVEHNTAREDSDAISGQSEQVLSGQSQAQEITEGQGEYQNKPDIQGESGENMNSQDIDELSIKIGTYLKFKTDKSTPYSYGVFQQGQTDSQERVSEQLIADEGMARAVQVAEQAESLETKHSQQTNSQGSRKGGPIATDAQGTSYRLHESTRSSFEDSLLLAVPSGTEDSSQTGDSPRARNSLRTDIHIRGPSILRSLSPKLRWSDQCKKWVELCVLGCLLLVGEVVQSQMKESPLPVIIAIPAPLAEHVLNWLALPSGQLRRPRLTYALRALTGLSSVVALPIFYLVKPDKKAVAHLLPTVPRALICIGELCLSMSRNKWKTYLRGFKVWPGKERQGTRSLAAETGSDLETMPLLDSEGEKIVADDPSVLDSLRFFTKKRLTGADDSGSTLLMKMASDGKENILKRLLAEGLVDIDAKDDKGESALLQAYRHGKVNIAEISIHAGADVNTKDPLGRTLLMLAASNGDVKLVGLLLKENALIDEQDSEGKTALHLAAGEDYPEVVRGLLGKGADFNIMDITGATALFSAVKERQTRVVEEFLACRGALKKKDRGGRTPLMFASEANDLTIVRLLLTRKVDIDAQDIDGVTALMYASAGGFVGIIKELKSHGANINAKDRFERSALLRVFDREDDWGNVAEVVQTLLDCGADITIRDVLGRTALQLARDYQETEVVEILTRKAEELAQREPQQIQDSTPPPVNTFRNRLSRVFRGRERPESQQEQHSTPSDNNNIINDPEQQAREDIESQQIGHSSDSMNRPEEQAQSQSQQNQHSTSNDDNSMTSGLRRFIGRFNPQRQNRQEDSDIELARPPADREPPS
ncbi:MAG: hypothetical protein M1831_002254 [Alyxoria varia]|nr:MAG: hypothetical protein M1831_002254 [Alyxoria varia]